MWSWQQQCTMLYTFPLVVTYRSPLPHYGEIRPSNSEYIQGYLPYRKMLCDSQHALNLFYAWQYNLRNTKQNVTAHPYPYTYYHMVPPGTFKPVLRNTGDSFGLRTLERSHRGKYPKHMTLRPLKQQTCSTFKVCSSFYVLAQNVPIKWGALFHNAVSM